MNLHDRYKKATDAIAAAAAKARRDPREVTHSFGRQTAPEGVAVYNPAFDVTPAGLIAAIICERGVIRPVNHQTIAAMLTR